MQVAYGCIDTTTFGGMGVITVYPMYAGPVFGYECSWMVPGTFDHEGRPILGD